MRRFTLAAIGALSLLAIGSSTAFTLAIDDGGATCDQAEAGAQPPPVDSARACADDDEAANGLTGNETQPDVQDSVPEEDSAGHGQDSDEVQAGAPDAPDTQQEGEHEG